MADRAPELLLPTPLLVAELGAYFAAEGSLPADIDGDGDEVEELMPFVLVCIPCGTGRLILVDIDWDVVAEGAILNVPRSAG